MNWLSSTNRQLSSFLFKHGRNMHSYKTSFKQTLGITFLICSVFFPTSSSWSQVITNNGALDSLAPQQGRNNTTQQPVSTTTGSSLTTDIKQAAGHAITPQQKQFLKDRLRNKFHTQEQMQKEIDSLRARVKQQDELLHKKSSDPKPLLSTTIPLGPPPVPHLASTPSDVELHPFPLPEQPVVHLQAQGTIQPFKDGVRITFAPGTADFNPDTHQAVLRYGQNLAYKTYKHALVDAYSTGKEDDPSYPRRVAFARGLAARSILMNGGTPSTRIYVRVKGIAKPPNPPGDYIDIYSSEDKHLVEPTPTK